MSQHSAHLKYRPDIDGLRALAVSCVVLYHLSPRRLPCGFIGVDIFFVISGYLITGILYTSAQAGDFSFLDFYARRARRIFPALVLVLLATLAAGAWILFADEYRQVGLHTVGGAGFAANFTLLLESGYFDSDSTVKPLLHLWSLGIEEQFYIFWPLLIYTFSQRPRRLVEALLAILVLSFFLNVYLVDTNREDEAFYFPLARFWELAVGALIAVFPPATGRRSLLAIGGCAAIGAALVLLTPGHRFPGWWALLPVLGAAALIYAGPATVPARILSIPPLVFVGLISYPLYLWHWPLIVYAKLTAGKTFPWPEQAGVLLLSVLLAWLTYRFVEVKVRRNARGRHATLAAACSLGVVGLMGAVIYWSDGLPARGPEFSRRWNEEYWPAAADPEYWRNPLARALFSGGFNRGRDFFLAAGTAPGPGEIAVIGDSHSTRVAVGLELATHNTARVINLGRGTCLPFLDVEPMDKGRPLDCQPAMNNIVHYVAHSPDISDVVIAAFYARYLDGRNAIRSLRPGLAAGEVFAGGLRATVAELVSAGKRVTLVADVPEMDFPVFDCTDRPLRFSPPRQDCFTPLQSHLRRTASAARIFREIQQAFPTVRIADPAQFLCDSARCYARMKQKVLYNSDGNHLSYEGARLLGEWLVDKIAASHHSGQPL